MDDAVHAVRQFNRTVTQRVGALNDEYLARKRPLGASRVLWEIGPGASDARSLRVRLDLDSGYLSRLLRSLEREGLVETEPDESDKRARIVRLTKRGRTERAILDRQSDDLARSLLAPFNDDERARLVDAMEIVERLFTAGLVTIGTENPRSEAARFCIESYFAELNDRFENGFDPGQSISADVQELTEPAGVLLIARLRGDAIGCGALKLHGRGPAEIKRMWVDVRARGLGVGRRILGELEQHARLRRVRVLRLETNRSLVEAQNLYRSAGFVEVAPFNDEPYAHHWFEKNLGRAAGPVGSAETMAPGATVRRPRSTSEAAARQSPVRR